MGRRPRRTSRDGASLLAAALGGWLWVGGVLVSPPARAQSFDPTFGAGGPGGAMPSMPPRKGASKGKGKPPPGMPETHAASGASDSILPAGSEPSLPAHPLELDPKTLALLGSDAAGDETEQGRSSDTVRKPWGPYYEEASGGYRLRTLFPLWLERTQPSLGKPSVTDRASLFGGVYYNRRSATHTDDILFPVFWNLSRPDRRTTIVGPFVNRRAPGESDDWLAPLYFGGSRPKGGGYTIIPPLLTYMKHSPEGGFNLFGPVFCSWKGGNHCDTATAEDTDYGLFPLYFHGEKAERKYTLIPPLLHYSAEDLELERSVEVWGPYYRNHSEDRDLLHLLPIYWSKWRPGARYTTVFPLFHHGYDEHSSLFVNPLFLLARGEHGESTFATWLYARYRGRTELDMVTPFFWHYRDPDIQLDQKLLFPLFYRRTSPRESDIAFFPFWAHFERYAISETTWVTPFFQHTHDLRGWQTNLHPILYTGRSGFDSHLVVAPVFWDFAGRASRSTVAFPLYWRFSEPESVHQLIGNVYYQENAVAKGLDWQLHIFPLFSYGETPDGHWWNLLYGLAGYTRQGDHVRVRSFWIPITVSGTPP